MLAVALFERALDRCEQVLTSIVRLNIDERLAAISEAHQSTERGGSYRWPGSPQLKKVAGPKLASPVGAER